ASSSDSVSGEKVCKSSFFCEICCQEESDFKAPCEQEATSRKRPPTYLLLREGETCAVLTDQTTATVHVYEQLRRPDSSKGGKGAGKGKGPNAVPSRDEIDFARAVPLGQKKVPLSGSVHGDRRPNMSHILSRQWLRLDAPAIRPGR
ncbi:unnamed protein product, partial [Amoebophrya sp. A25]